MPPRKKESFTRYRLKKGPGKRLLLKYQSSAATGGGEGGGKKMRRHRHAIDQTIPYTG